MANRRVVERVRGDHEPASAVVSRLIVVGFLVAAALGLLSGLVWVGWNLAETRFGG